MATAKSVERNLYRSYSKEPIKSKELYKTANEYLDFFSKNPTLKLKARLFYVN
jgi:hypothetical protein